MISKCVVTIVALAAVAVYGLELSENGKKIVGECQKQHKIQTEQIKQAFQEKKLPQTENGKCFLECVMEKAKIIQNNQVDVATAKKINAAKLKDKPDIKAKTEQVIDICSKVKKPSGKCEYGVEIMKCVVKNAKERGVPAPIISNI